MHSCINTCKTHWKMIEMLKYLIKFRWKIVNIAERPNNVQEMEISTDDRLNPLHQPQTMYFADHFVLSTKYMKKLKPSLKKFCLINWKLVNFKIFGQLTLYCALEYAWRVHYVHYYVSFWNSEKSVYEAAQ